MIELEAYVNVDNQWDLQIPAIDGQPATTFEPTDTLACSIWQGQSQAVVTTATAEWLQEVSSITLGVAGSGYTTAPTVTISGGGATDDATAYATIANGAVTGVFMTHGGEGYDGSAVTVAFSGGGGSGATATANVTLGWQTGIVSLVLGDTASSVLTPAGTYRFEVILTRGIASGVVIDGLMKVIATPGDVPPSPPDLITYDYAESYCAILGLTDAQRDVLPGLVASASMAIRRWCFDRNFDLRSYVEFQTVVQGAVRLFQPPVQIITRVQGQPQLALTINNTSAQTAQAYFAYSGTWQGYATAAQTVTGITLTSVSSGVATTTTVSFVSNQTISALATLINAVGSGWVATTNSTYSAWPVTELDGGYVGQGCAIGAAQPIGAQFNVLLDLAPGEFSLDVRRMGILYVGRQYTGFDAGRWGPGGDSLFSQPGAYGRVKVSYMGGESVIPQQVQLACAELVKFFLLAAKTDWILKSETAQEYSYTLADKMIAFMPANVMQALSQYRIPRA